MLMIIRYSFSKIEFRQTHGCRKPSVKSSNSQRRLE